MTQVWPHVTRADTPLILAMPHDGTLLLPGTFRSDRHLGALYARLAEATVNATDISRSITDVNRDPSGASVYSGQATTAMCPTTSFDGDPL